MSKKTEKKSLAKSNRQRSASKTKKVTKKISKPKKLGTSQSKTKISTKNLRLSSNCKKIVFKSRYGEPRILEWLGPKQACISGMSRWIRCAADVETGDLNMIDFEGGPCIVVGSRIEGAGIVLKLEKKEFIQQEDDKDEWVSVTFSHDASG